MAALTVFSSFASGVLVGDSLRETAVMPPPRWTMAGTTYALLGDSEEGVAVRITAGDFVHGCSITAPPRPRGPGGVHGSDPGFAFRDLNCNGLYEALLDQPVANATLRSGTFDAGAGCLVIPPSVGAIVATTLTYKALGGLTVAVNLTATGGTLTLASSGRIAAERIALVARDNLHLATTNALHLNRTEALTTGGGTIQLDAGSNHTIWASNVSLVPASNLKVNAGDNVVLDDTWVKSITGNLQVTAGRSLLAQRAVLRAPSGNVQLAATAGAMELDGALVLSSSGNFQPSAGTTFRARAACLKSQGNFQVLADGAASGWVDVTGSTLLSDQLLEVKAKYGFANLTKATLSAGSHINVISASDVGVNHSRLVSSTGALTVTVGSSQHRLFVEGAWFDDGDDVVQLRPQRAQAVGTPANGQVRA